MNKEFLQKDCILGLIYITFIIYLISGFGVRNPYSYVSDLISKYSFLTFPLFLIQLILWKKDKDREFFKNKIALFISLFIINFYFFWDSYFSHYLKNWMNTEKVGWSFNLLSVLAALFVISQSLFWFGILIKKILISKFR